MAWRGLCSRRQAERLIDAGHVRVDGAVIRTQGTKVPFDAEIVISEAGEEWRQNWVTVLLHKPPGIVSTQAEGDQKPAWELITPDRQFSGKPLPPIERPWTLSVAGRLDRASRGLLVLTQDGRLTKLITGGSDWDKEYHVKVDKSVDAQTLQRLRSVTTLDGRQLKRMIIETMGKTKLRFVLREGKKHQIRRVCEEAGLQVTDLLRVRVGTWNLGQLPVGSWMPIPTEEVSRLVSQS